MIKALELFEVRDGSGKSKGIFLLKNEAERRQTQLKETTHLQVIVLPLGDTHLNVLTNILK